MCFILSEQDSNGGHDDVHGQLPNELFRWNRRFEVTFDRKPHMLNLDSFQSTLLRRLLLHKVTRRQWTGGHWGSLYMR